MSNGTRESHEILQIFESQKAIYSEIHQLTDQAILNQSRGHSCEEIIKEVDNRTDLLKANNHRLQQLLNESSENQSASERSQIEASRSEIEKMAMEVLQKTRQLENELRSTRDGMIPELNQQVVASKMFRAYQRDGAPDAN